jgi:NTP pyrophosphatase (non-canonical NTP hydrolase)
MDLKEFSKRNRARNEEAFPSCRNWTTSDWLVALMGEVGEAANIHKKSNRGDYDKGDSLKALNAFGKELADAFTYLDLVAESVGLDLEDIVIQKWNEVSLSVGSARRIGPGSEQTSEGTCSESDGCPTEMAVLKRFWRANQPGSIRVSDHVKVSVNLTPTGVNESDLAVIKPGQRLFPEDLRKGMMVRYDSGSTAICKLSAPHAGGWHAFHCMGGTCFTSASYPTTLYAATEDDLNTWEGNKRWRNDFGRRPDRSDFGRRPDRSDSC